MNKLSIFFLSVLFFSAQLNAEVTLTIQDHTKVMKFLIDHPVALKNWLKSRGRTGNVSPEEVFNFISAHAGKRSSSEVLYIVNKARRLNRRTRAINPGGNYNDIMQKIQSARNLEELRLILSREKNRISRVRTRNRRIISLSMGLEIASQIIEDGIANGIYSPDSYAAFLGRKRTRGIWNALKDELLDTAKHDAAGAIIGALIGPEGAVGGAIAASSASVAEVVLDLVLNPEPAY